MLFSTETIVLTCTLTRGSEAITGSQSRQPNWSRSFGLPQRSTQLSGTLTNLRASLSGRSPCPDTSHGGGGSCMETWAPSSDSHTVNFGARGSGDVIDGLIVPST